MGETNDNVRQDEAAGGDERERQEPAPDLLERAVSWVSMALVLALAGFLLWEALQQTSPPVIAAQAEAPWQAEGIYYLPLEVSNEGGRSVQNLRLRVRLLDGRRVVEASETLLSWLPAHSTRRTVAVFERDPRPYDVQVLPEGYEQP